RPLFHPPVEDVERQRSLAQELVMKGADVEAGTQLALGARTHCTHRELAALVRQRLPRPHDVAIDFARDVLLRLRAVGFEVLDRLLPRPPELVDAGVEHETDGTPHL